MTQRIAQKDSHGCAIASLAMVTGHDYDKVKAFYHPRVDFSREGVAWYQAEEYLARHGFAVRRFTRYNPATNELREPWPIAPFADVHMCEVVTVDGGHSVVMLADGRVLDPWDELRDSLTHPHYIAVHFVAGIYPVAHTSQTPPFPPDRNAGG
jgi:ABC-type bacteriocin/lantibiotic exporter with double-glycine peptidase domain